MAEDDVIALLKQKGMILSVRNALFETFNRSGILNHIQAQLQAKMMQSRLLEEAIASNRMDEQSIEDLKERLISECFEGAIKQMLTKEIETLVDQNQHFYASVIQEAIAIVLGQRPTS